MSKYPDRLVAFGGVSPLADYAAPKFALMQTVLADAELRVLTANVPSHLQ